ncbi:MULTISPECIES: hypothetical protein [unclassified Microcoleus]|uniref:hypothetical protein n=1 Tax=unclassified Microcoleus TaxID=2642155 RepID=UPI002FD71745
MLDKFLNLLSDRTVSNLAMKLLLNLQRRGVIESDSDAEEYEHLGLTIQLKSVELNTRVKWCVYDRLKQGASHDTKSALSDAIIWIDNLNLDDSTQLD